MFKEFGSIVIEKHSDIESQLNDLRSGIKYLKKKEFVKTHFLSDQEFRSEFTRNLMLLRVAMNLESNLHMDWQEYEKIILDMYLKNKWEHSFVMLGYLCEEIAPK